MQNVYHPKVRISDALKNASEIFWEFRASRNGTTVDAEKDRFAQAEASGAIFLPYFDGQCSNFDEQVGCRGHLEREALASAMGES